MSIDNLADYKPKISYQRKADYEKKYELSSRYKDDWKLSVKELFDGGCMINSN